MTQWLRQSTAVDLPVGPFLDSVDGNTQETALTITQPDIRLKKNGGAWAQKSAAQTLTHEEFGWYEVNLSTTDTNTLGLLKLAIHEAGAGPVWDNYMVVPAPVYDALILGTRTEPGQAAPPLSTDLVTMISHLYTDLVRNHRTNDGTTEKVYADDATTVIKKRTVSESAGVVTKGEQVAGP